MTDLHVNYKNKILKNKDAWSTVYIYDPIAIFVIKYLYQRKIKISSNVITIIGLVISILAVICMVKEYLVAVIILLQLVNIIDCIDGKWARLHNATSEFGRKLDAGVDLFTHGIVISLVAHYVSKNSTSVGLVLALIAFLLSYIHLKEIFSEKPTNNLRKTIRHNNTIHKWNKFTQSRRLISRPISEVELAFILPSIAILESTYSQMFPLTFLIAALYVVCKVLIK